MTLVTGAKLSSWKIRISGRTFRSTVGWKALQTAEILMEPYMVRVECCSAFSPTAEAN